MSGEPGPGRHLRRGRGRGRLPAALRGQPRHHDRRRHPGRGGVRARGSSPRAPERETSHVLQRRPRRPRHRLLAARRLARRSGTSSRVENVRDHRGRPRRRRACRSSRSRTATAWAARSFNYGFSAVHDQDLIATAVATAKQAKIAFLMLPGLGTTEDIRQAAGHRGLGHPHRHPLHRGRHLRPALQGRPQHRAGDRRLPDDGAQPAPGGARQAGPDHGRRRRPVRLRGRLGRLADHGRRQRPGRGAGRRARRRRPGRLPRSREPRRSGWPTRFWPPGRAPPRSTAPPAASAPGAGNTPVEAFAAVTERLGIKTGIDTAEDHRRGRGVVAPVMSSNPPELDRLSLTMGYAGVYSSFLKHAEIQAAQVRRVRGRDPPRGRPPQARRRPGRPAHRDRGGPRQPQVAVRAGTVATAIRL